MSKYFFEQFEISLSFSTVHFTWRQHIMKRKHIYIHKWINLLYNFMFSPWRKKKKFAHELQSRKHLLHEKKSLFCLFFVEDNARWYWRSNERSNSHDKKNFNFFWVCSQKNSSFLTFLSLNLTWTLINFNDALM